MNMTRPLRIEKREAFYHVITRGNRGDDIFANDGDKLYFLDHLGRAATKYSAVFYAYCLMSNHYHLLIETKEPNLSSVMHYINSSFASHLRKGREVGHIFAGRYKSILAEKGESIAPLSRYVHLNPVRASLTAMPEEYHWSSYRYFVERGAVPGWLDTSWLVGSFGGTLEAARKRYRDYVENGTFEEFSFELDCRQAGREPVTGSVEREAPGKEERAREGLPPVGPPEGIFVKPVRLSDLHTAACSFYSLERLDGESGGLDGYCRRARNMFIWLAREYTAAQNCEIGNYAGGLSSSGITQQFLRTNEALKRGKECPDRWRHEAQAILSILVRA